MQRVGLFGDSVRLAVIAGIALASGAAFNALRPKSLPMRYQRPAEQLASGAPNESVQAQLISLEETRAALGRSDVVIVDARHAVFFQAGHLPGAINIPHDKFSEYFPRVQDVLRADDLAGVIIYCSGGDCVDSARMARHLAARGIGPLAIYQGGWEEWTSRGPFGETQ